MVQAKLRAVEQGPKQVGKRGTPIAGRPSLFDVGDKSLQLGSRRIARQAREKQRLDAARATRVGRVGDGSQRFVAGQARSLDHEGAIHQIQCL